MTAIDPARDVDLREAVAHHRAAAVYPVDAGRGGAAAGYDNPSQFSREYRRQFGAPPSQDAARLRQAARTPAGAIP